VTFSGDSLSLEIPCALRLCFETAPYPSLKAQKSKSQSSEIQVSKRKKNHSNLIAKHVLSLELVTKFKSPKHKAKTQTQVSKLRTQVSKLKKNQSSLIAKHVLSLELVTKLKSQSTKQNPSLKAQNSSLKAQKSQSQSTRARDNPSLKAQKPKSQNSRKPVKSHSKTRAVP
jgi:hypothetical protein